jgi:hypothetical protein
LAVETKRTENKNKADIFMANKILGGRFFEIKPPECAFFFINLKCLIVSKWPFVKGGFSIFRNRWGPVPDLFF